MTAEKLWQLYLAENKLPALEMPQAWCFGSDNPDLLLSLTLKAVKTATASAYPLYGLEGDPLPKPGNLSIILNRAGEAKCIIETIRVRMLPFLEVDAEHAYKEGEGDRTLDGWRAGHRKFFGLEFSEAGLPFSEDIIVVCEEYRVIYAVD